MASRWTRYWRSLGHVRKVRVEECVTLSLSWMLQNNCLDLAVGENDYRTITWRGGRISGKPFCTLTVKVERTSTYEMNIDLLDTSQRVYLHSTPLHFGGVRWWFSCPRCWRRCAKLYLRGSLFGCRVCLNLTYESCQEETAAFLGELAAQLGISPAQIKREMAQDTRQRKEWRRKRDRRTDYKRRNFIQGKSVKRRIREAKAISDLAKVLGRIVD